MDFLADAQIDFHDKGILNEFLIEELLNEFLVENYNVYHTKLLVITGKGKLVKPCVERYLKNHMLVKSFKQASYWNGQEGAFEVVLKES